LEFSVGQRAASAITTEAGAAGVVPATLNTGRGPVEYVAWGEGPAVLAIHGAMGGYDQSALLAETIGDPVVCARTLQDPEAGPLLRALQLSTYDWMARRLPGTRNDIEVTRSTTYPLERVGVPTLVVHGTGHRLVPFDEHGKVLATRIPGAELLAIEGGEHVGIFTHRREVRARVTGFLRAHVSAAAYNRHELGRR
jgi:hypothetical protein